MNLALNRQHLIYSLPAILCNGLPKSHLVKDPNLSKVKPLMWMQTQVYSFIQILVLISTEMCQDPV